ncbi:DUF1707 SHOCT-like domain-containing protein [Corynebacterium coyleae]|uniref:DUF1707 SHOCT-like domain-containing protein n=1 Tax=Corynebacterium coyleae TaxID=53374 RepID=UPI000C7588E0|nr:DUF1707 domain-containing protein [Corynebacterium coyleae]PLA28181.1 hypothetical protein CYJ45_04320 [Corynebacterium coyleae]
MSDANLPRKRLSSAERDRAAAFLHDAFVDGQLTVTEFDERSRMLYEATFIDELPALIDDLSPVTVQHASGVRNYVTGESGGSQFSLAVMGGSERGGDWLVAPTHTSLTVMGGSSIDLREARLSSYETEINAFAIMGGIEIVVPDDVRVVDSGIGIMGGFGVETHSSCRYSLAEIPVDAPVVRIRGLALMGGVGIVRAARGARI